MLSNKATLDTIDVKDKRVLIRVDFNGELIDLCLFSARLPATLCMT